MKDLKKLGSLIVLILLIAVVAFFWWQFKKPSVVYETDTTIEGNLDILEGERYLVKNASIITVKGDMNVVGKLDCKDGSITVIVSGKLTVGGELRCERDKKLSEGDLGQGISIVAEGDVEFLSTAVVVTNGHVQLVDEQFKLATTQEKIDELFNDAADDSGEGTRIGPFIPIELAEGQEAFVPPIIDVQNNKKTKQNIQNSRNLLSTILIKKANAVEPARDIDDDLVPRTVKIGGKWIVGRPNRLPPFDITVPTPPEGIKKIIIAYDFGPGADVNISDLGLTGPDGRPGIDDDGASCNAKGSKGEDAFRLNVRAANITVNNFSLSLGNGGDGGSAVTQADCDPGIAVGGKGGEPGNIKMRSSGTFKILGEFKITPGIGGLGGGAMATGKIGKDACAGENGGEAKATGGKGGDNKKGLKTVNVSGLANITIEPIVAGEGGLAFAVGGNGGDGDECGCDGGSGGKATATGGKGGTATSRTVASTGGNGGDAEAHPGMGGDGGDCTQIKPGGNGGAGGDAIVKGGKAGTGRTNNGTDGNVLSETGGDGGNGGDGCKEGKGGAGGNGNPKGEDGEDGKNICPIDEENTNVNENINLNENVNTNENINADTDDGTGTTNDGDLVLLPIEFFPTELVQMHLIGETDCPQHLGRVTVTLPRPGRITVTHPGWVNPPEVEDIETEIVQMDLQFNCNITNFKTHKESGKVQVKAYDSDGTFFADSFFDVFIEVELPSEPLE